MRSIARHAKERTVIALLRPDDATRARTMNDQVIDAAQGRKTRRLEKHLRRKPLEPRDDPRGVPFGEFARRVERSALGHRQDDVPRSRANAQRKAPRRSQAFQGDTMNSAAMSDFEMSDLRARRAALKKTQHDSMNRRVRVESLVRQSITAGEILDARFI